MGPVAKDMTSITAFGYRCAASYWNHFRRVDTFGFIVEHL